MFRRTRSQTRFALLLSPLLNLAAVFSVHAADADQGLDPKSKSSTAPAAKTVATPAIQSLDTVVVSASRENMMGIASASSQGAVTKLEIELRPVYRVGQLLETIPGLAVTAHSGEGKANQYLLRGFSLDHGTDLATFVDEMPVNMRTHAHGQGYTDLNFIIPELAGGIAFTKGPYYASEGDFASVGADHTSLVNVLPDQISVSAGTVGDRRVFAGGTLPWGNGNLLGAAEVVHQNGPWTSPEELRKYNGVLRYSEGSKTDGFSITAMAYKDKWNATTDQPERAIDAGLIDRFGTLDPSDGGRAQRFSLSGLYAKSWGDWLLIANVYVIKNKLTLWNDFTHDLVDPVNGDQHAQNEDRTLVGGAASATHMGLLFGHDSNLTIGVQTRYDDNNLDLQHTVQRQVLSTDRDDHVKESSVAVYGESKIYWAPWLRSIVGAREDYFHSQDEDRINPGNSGSESQSLFQPKASLVLGPFYDTEFYLSTGRGFHSNDTRAGLDDNGNYVRPPLLVKAKGSEIGLRTNAIPNLQLALTFFKIDFNSELTYNADQGTTEAGRPSHRTGFELTGQYRPWPWLELSADLSRARARYLGDDPGGNYIEDAPDYIASFGALLKRGAWTAGIAFRDLGAHPLVSDNSVRSDGYSEWNANVGYQISPTLKVRLDVFNLLDQKSDAADYYYTTRLPGEPPDGVEGIQIHPLEPRSARLTLTKIF